MTETSQIGSAFHGMFDAVLAPFDAYLSGNPLSMVVAVKGKRGVAEEAGEEPLSGADGIAFSKALASLGYSSDAWCGILTCPVGQVPLGHEQLMTIIAAIAPRFVVAFDHEAAQQLENGKCAVAALGPTLIELDGFEDALDDDEAKRVVWQRLKQSLA